MSEREKKKSNGLVSIYVTLVGVHENQFWEAKSYANDFLFDRSTGELAVYCRHSSLESKRWQVSKQ